MNHIAYRSDLVFSYFRLLGPFKKYLSAKRFTTDADGQQSPAGHKHLTSISSMEYKNFRAMEDECLSVCGHCCVSPATHVPGLLRSQNEVLVVSVLGSVHF